MRARSAPNDKEYKIIKIHTNKMKKALFSLLLTIACLPMVFGQQPANVVVEESTITACGSYTWIDGSVFTHDTIVTLVQDDTVYVLDLTVTEPSIDTATAIVLSGGCNVEWNNKVWETAGTFIDTIRAEVAGQCDSVIKIEISLAGTDRIEAVEATACDFYVTSWGDTITTSVDALDTLIATSTCGLTIGSLNITIHQSDSAATEEIASAEGCSMMWNGIEVAVADSVYYYTLESVNGCDSVVSVKVGAFTGSVYDTTDVVACDFYVHEDDTIRSSTNISELDTTGDCHIYNVIAVTIVPSYRDTASVVVRDTMGGCNLVWFGSTYGEDAVGDTLYGLGRTVVGQCDSLVAVRLQGFTGTHHDTNFVEYCGRYIWRHGSTRDTITTDGEYSYSTTANGCTTVEHLMITFHEEYDTIEAGTVCARYTYTFRSRSGIPAAYDNAQFTTSGLHTTDQYGEELYSTDNSTRCVTHHAVNVVIREPEQRYNDVNIDTVVCDALTFTFNRNSITWDFSADSALRDSFYTTRQCYDVYGHVKVTVNKRDTVRYVINACDSYTWTGYTDDTYTRSTTASVVLPDTTNANGCRIVGMLDLTINQTPTVTIEGDWNLYSDSVNQTTLTAVSNMPIETWKWYRNGSPLSETSNKLTVTNVSENIDIRLESTSEDGCTTNNWITITYNVGIDESEAVAVNIYPNPATRYINIECVEGLKEVVVYNAIGQQVIMRSLDGVRSTLDLGSLVSGNYTMRITSVNGEQVTRKFIVNK